MAKSIFALCGLILGVGLFGWLAGKTADFSPEDAALGPFTEARDARFDGCQVVFRNGDQMDEARATLATWLAEEKPVALWLGASHLYAINRFHPGEENAVYHANQLARDRSSSLSYLGVGLPNGNLNEFLAVYLYFRQYHLLPKWLIVGIVYDDLREPGIRPKIRELIPPIGEEMVARFGPGVGNLRAQKEAVPQAPLKRNAVAGTPQERLEWNIVSRMEDAWPVFGQRHRLNAYLSWVSRRGLFDIGELFRRMGNPTKRVPPVPLDMKVWNEAALESLVAMAGEDGVEVLLYQAPHPQSDGPFYHIRERYDAFFAQLRSRCREQGIQFLDLEKLIPLSYWMFGTAIDPWHFQESGHRLLAEAIDLALKVQEAKALNAFQQF